MQNATNNKNTWGENPSEIVKLATELLSGNNLAVLDLGAGYGRDSIFLSNLGFLVDAVDKNEFELAKITEKDKKINTILTDIKDFDFIKKYDLIIAINSLHFLQKQDIKIVLEKIKKSLKNSGTIVISILLDNNKISFNKLLSIFNDFEIILSREFEKEDKPHKGMPFPHTHKIAEFIIKKK